MNALPAGQPRWVRVTPTANALVYVAVHLLPAGEARDRYRVEHDAELRALPVGRQVTYAVGALMTAVDLRRATSSAASEPGLAEQLSTVNKPLLCRLNLRHKWRTEHAPEGGFYRRCVTCGKDDPGSYSDHVTDIIGGHF